MHACSDLYTVLVRMSLKKNRVSRAFHVVMTLVFVFLLTSALVALGTFARKHNEIQSDSIYGEFHLDSCILNAEFDNDDPFVRGPFVFLSCGDCKFVIWAEAVLAMVVGLLGASTVIKTIFGIST